jgi:hypothetical protein
MTTFWLLLGVVAAFGLGAGFMLLALLGVFRRDDEEDGGDEC